MSKSRVWSFLYTVLTVLTFFKVGRRPEIRTRITVLIALRDFYSEIKSGFQSEIKSGFHSEIKSGFHSEV